MASACAAASCVAESGTRRGVRSSALSRCRPAPCDVRVRGPQRAVATRALALETPTADAPGRFTDVRPFDGNKRLQIQVVEVAEDTVAIRSLDWDRARFDIEFSLTEGTTYNAYLIFGEDKTALVDASHEKFRGLFMDALAQELSSRGRTLDYLLVSHTEPDHSGLAGDVLERYPGCTALGSKVCLQFLRGLNPGRTLQAEEVKGGTKVDLGGGHVLEFVMAPNLHWPDTMFTFDHRTGVMFTCDAFGSHLCTAQPFDVSLEEMLPHYAFYYDCLMRPNAKSVTTALRKVKQANLEWTTIATGHGPMLRFNLAELVDKYKTWSEQTGQATASVAVLYCSDYGFSDRLSQTIARGITKAGVATEMADLMQVDPQELVAIIGRSAGIVLLSPPSTSKTAQSSRAVLLSAIKPKQKILVAESFGGEDEPVDTLVAEMVAVNVDVAADPLRLKATPDQAAYQLYEEAGTDLAQLLTQKDKISALKGSMPAPLAKALARVSGGLYVVTAASGPARSAMVASWVTQASFEPLGLTVAVAKDRAIESLMQVGDKFALNVLEEGKYQPTLKHFLTRFPAGADRFEGVEVVTEPGFEAPVLGDSIAHLHLQVASRMDAGDHWVIYAEVLDGGVRSPDAKTAVHRRKVASYY